MATSSVDDIVTFKSLVTPKMRYLYLFAYGMLFFMFLIINIGIYF